MDVLFIPLLSVWVSYLLQFIEMEEEEDLENALFTFTQHNHDDHHQWSLNIPTIPIAYLPHTFHSPWVHYYHYCFTIIIIIVIPATITIATMPPPPLQYPTDCRIPFFVCYMNPIVSSFHLETRTYVFCKHSEKTLQLKTGKVKWDSSQVSTTATAVSWVNGYNFPDGFTEILFLLTMIRMTVMLTTTL